jgi:DNA-binding NtrC family response regulator
VNIVVPPLRQRPEDIPVFFKQFAKEIAQKHGIHFAGISPSAMAVLESYHWPGNVRELRNVVESLLVLGQGKYLEPDDVTPHLKEFRSAEDDRNLPVPLVGRSVEQAERELIFRALLDIKSNLVDLKNLLVERQEQENSSVVTAEAKVPISIQDMEHKLIAEALDRFKGNRRVAARALSISERTLYRKIKEYGLG